MEVLLSFAEQWWAVTMHQCKATLVVKTSSNLLAQGEMMWIFTSEVLKSCSRQIIKKTLDITRKIIQAVVLLSSL